ncbi:hypothetical protein [Mycobacterium sp. 94-17]|uniref:hypothetical protein n=1 Tax=Mycobacterium sp. 94-17 TaxID=2986147 RepID=UPI002D1EDD6E|nr:hypothetical protein [Mycobacterium sp. 94-17]MEB4208749.1 hypothetical protein [Mycobacterium sp. 94-17]
MNDAAREARRDAKAVAAEALRGVRKSTALPRRLGFLTGASVPVEGRIAPRKPWEDVG